MRKLLFLLLFFPFLATAAEYQVKVHVTNLPENSGPKLLKIFNGDIYVIDSLPHIDNETLTFTVPDGTDPGMLRIILGFTPYAKYTNGQPTTVDILFNRENVEFTTDFNSPDKSLVINQSDENKMYFDFLKQDMGFYSKLGILEQTVTQYPDKDEFYNLALRYYEQYQQDRDKIIQDIHKKNPHSLAAKIIYTRRMPFSKGNTPAATRDSIFKAEFLNAVDFQDTTLLFTNVYTDKLYQYINFYMTRNSSPRENEANIIRAVDEIMPKISVNDKVRNTLLQFLIGGFESMKLEEVLAHISANYMQQCGSDMDIVKRRLEAYQKMAVGNKVPDMLTMDINNNPVSLYGSLNPYTLLIFWHSDCGHCQLLVQELPSLINSEFFKKHNINVVGISIDENREDWVKYSEAHPLNWTNTFVEGAFNSQVAVDYNLFATPSMFLLDNENKIVAKPLTVEEVLESINKL